MLCLLPTWTTFCHLNGSYCFCPHGLNFVISVSRILFVNLFLKKKKRKIKNIWAGIVAGVTCHQKTRSSEEHVLLDDCFERFSKLTAIERSILYYITGNVAHTEKCNVMLGEVPKTSGIEFTIVVSPGKLAHPNEELLDLTLCLYAYYELLKDKR